jgi:hypothetical protein
MKAEKPRMRRAEDVENNLRELKVKKWTQKGDTTEEFGSVVKQAKVLRGAVGSRGGNN